MRKAVREHNVYGWAAGLIGEVCDVRLDIADSGENYRAGASAGRF
jgi:hypothetical protein